MYIYKTRGSAWAPANAGAHASGRRAGRHSDEEKGKKLLLFDSTSFGSLKQCREFNTNMRLKNHNLTFHGAHSLGEEGYHSTQKVLAIKN